MNFLITGGAGFIGSYLRGWLLAAGMNGQNHSDYGGRVGTKFAHCHRAKAAR